MGHLPAWSQYFTNVAFQQGLDTIVTAFLGSSVSFHDFDQDGQDDVTIAIPYDSLRLYRNQGGQLVALPPTLAMPGETKFILWADIDNDGEDDLMVLFYEGPMKLYHNQGGLQFTDITEAAGLPTWNAPHFGISFGDYDRDGHLDLYVATYYYGGPEDYRLLNHLYRNNGDLTFTDVTLTAGVSDGFKASFQPLWFDHDMDGWPDLYVITDKSPLNSLFRNNGDGTFTNITESTGSGCPNTDSMSASLGDPDNNGLLDIFVTNNGSNLLPDRPCRFLKRQPDGTYLDLAEQYGLDCAYFGWGAVWADVDNHGWQDLFVASEGSTGAQLHLNATIPPMINASWLLLENPPVTTYTAARGDLDSDGHPDFLVGSEHPHPPQLWLNAGNSGKHYLRITPQGTVSNRMAVGTWIRVCSAGQCQVRYTTCGENYVSQDSQHQHVGLRNATYADSVIITYPSGHTDRYYDVEADQHLWPVEGETYVVSIEAQGPTTFCSGGSVVLDAGEHDAYLWNTGHTGRYLTVTGGGTYGVTITTEHGLSIPSPMLVITVLPSPAIVPAVTQPACADDANGSISLGNATGIPALSVTWAHGAAGAHLQDLAAGNYSYTYTDINGCSTSGSIQLVEPPELFVLVETGPAVIGGDGSITILAFGGTPPHTYWIDGQAASGSNTGLWGGSYLVEVIDANGCTFSEEVYVGGPTLVMDAPAPVLRLWPNPAGDEVRIAAPWPVLQAELLDGSGRLVHAWTRIAEGRLDLPGLPLGAYHLVVHGPGERVTASLLVAR